MLGSLAMLVASLLGLRDCFSVGQPLFVAYASRPRAGGSLALIPSCLCAARNAGRSESFCLAAVSDAATKKSTNRPLAVVEAREELHTQRRADGHERAHKIYRERERRAVVRDVLGQAVPVVLAAPAHGQAADGAARA